MYKIKKCKECGSIQSHIIICDTCGKKLNGKSKYSYENKEKEIRHFCDRNCVRKWRHKND